MIRFRSQLGFHNQLLCMGIEACDFGTILHSAQPGEPLSHPDSCEFLIRTFSSSKFSHPDVVLGQGNQTNVPAIWDFPEGYPQYGKPCVNFWCPACFKMRIRSFCTPACLACLSALIYVKS